MKWIFSSCVNYGCCYGIKDLITGKIISVCCVYPPGNFTNGTEINASWRFVATLLRNGQLPSSLFTDKMQKRAKAIKEVHHQFHAKYACNNHWYISILGVDPNHQNKGTRYFTQLSIFITFMN